MILPPRFIDTVQSVDPVAAGGANNPANWTAVGGTSFGNTTDLGVAAELTRRYSYWTYIAQSRIAERMAQTFPCFGFPVKAQGKPRLSQSQREWLVQKYGWERFSAPDVDMQILQETHPLVLLMKNVNPRDTWEEFISDTVIQWRLTGRFYWWVIPNGLGTPAEIWPIPTAWVNPIYNQDGTLKHYEVMPTRNCYRPPQIIPPQDIVVGEYRSPEDPRVPMSGTMAAPHWHEGTISIEKSRSSHFRNGIHPDLLLHLDRELYGNPNDDVLKRIKERFINRTAGVHRAGEPVIVPGGVKAEKWTNSPKEMDYPDSAEQVRDNTLALEGCPAIVAGISHDYNRATADAAFEVWCEVILNPAFRRLAGVMQKKLGSRYDSRIHVWYADCRPRNAEQRLNELKALKDFGLWPNQMLQEFGLPRVEKPEYDTGYLPAGMQPIEFAAEPPEPDPLPPEPDSNDPVDEEQPDDPADDE